MIDIRTYSKKRKTDGATTSSGSGFANNATIETSSSSGGEVNGVYLWGQYHDHTGDVDGDMTVNGKVAANRVNATNGNILYLTSTDITTQGLTADQIEAIRATIDILTSENITCDNLTVLKAAHFFKLIIDEVKAAQGQIILTPANAVIAKVEPFNSTDYKCYFKATDGDKKILQCFEVDDQLICQTFNVADGVSYDVSNKYYWRKVTDVSSTPVSTLIDGENYDCHWFVLSDSDKDTYSNAAPEKGDEVVLLGNRTDTTRQAAISIGAYDNPFLDATIKAPFIIQYDGINNYNLSSHRKNVISREMNYLTASNVSGNNILNTSQWTNVDLSPCTYDKEYFNYSTTATEDEVGNVYYDAFSPIIYVEEGNYTFSYYTEFNPTVSVAYKATKPNRPTDLITYISPTTSGTISTDVWMDNPRKYITFNVADSGYICISVGLQNNAEDGLFQCPQLEIGTEVTVFDDSSAITQSQILMTKDEIDLSLANAGINIQGDSVTITGNLRAIDDSWYLNKNGEAKIGGWHVEQDELFSDKGISNNTETTYQGQTDFKPNIELDGTNAMIRVNGVSSDLQIGSLDFTATTNINATVSDRKTFDAATLHETYLKTHITNVGDIYAVANLYDDTLNMKTGYNHKVYQLKYTFNIYAYAQNYYERIYGINKLQMSMRTANTQLFDCNIFVDNSGAATIVYDTTTYSTITPLLTYDDNGRSDKRQRTYTLTVYFGDVDVSTDDQIINEITPTFRLMTLNGPWSTFDGYEEYFFQNIRYETLNYTSRTNTSIVSDKGVKFVQSSGASRLQFDGTSADMICNGRGLTVNNSRTKQVIQNVEYPLTKLNATKRYGDVTVGRWDEFMVIDTNQTTTLDISSSDACYDGHKIYVKALNGQSIQVTGSVIDYDDDAIRTNKSWNDKVPRMFVYCGNCWYISKLG